jgi:hypothetical protein
MYRSEAFLGNHEALLRLSWAIRAVLKQSWAIAKQSRNFIEAFLGHMCCSEAFLSNHEALLRHSWAIQAVPKHS